MALSIWNIHEHTRFPPKKKEQSKKNPRTGCLPQLPPCGERVISYAWALRGNWWVGMVLIWGVAIDGELPLNHPIIIMFNIMLTHLKWALPEMEVPLVIIHFHRITKPSSYWGTPIYRNPHMEVHRHSYLKLHGNNHLPSLFFSNYTISFHSATTIY